jgi:hypothetical protein
MFEVSKDERQSGTVVRAGALRGRGASTCPSEFLIYCVTPVFHVS